MRKVLTLCLAVGGLFAFLEVGRIPADARICAPDPVTGKTSTDLWANGGHLVNGVCTAGNETEIAQDSRGNLEPTITSTVSLGTSSLLWNDVETNNINQGGGAIAVGGQQTMSLPPVLPILSTTTLAGRSDPIGALALVKENVAGAPVTNAYNECISTAASVSSYVYIAVSTSAAAKAGAACSN